MSHHGKPDVGVSSSPLKIPNIAESNRFLEIIDMPTLPTFMTTTGKRPAKIPTSTRKGYERRSYRLPLCAKHTNSYDYLNMTIAEPMLEWLGVAYNGGRVEASINGEPLSLTHDGKTVSGGLDGIRDWVHVGHLAPPAPAYNVSFCSRRIDKTGQSAVWLHQLVGLLLPAPTSTMDTIVP
jgi:hypothetical protein